VFLKRKRFFRPQLEALEDRFAPAVSVLGGFNGMSNTGYNPPNTSVAAGPDYVAETVNSSLAIFNKATGVKVSQQKLSTLFSGFVTGDLSMFDPSVMYDDLAGRFVVEGQVCDSINHKSYVDIAVSNSSDPTGGFSELHQIEVDEGGVNWSDNGKLGFNADAYVFTGNMIQFTSAATYHELVLTINKNTVLDQNNSTFAAYLVDEPSYVSLVPARMHGSVAGGPMWFVETSPAGGNSVTVTRMGNVLSPTPTFTDFSLPVNSYIQAQRNPPQPGGTVGADDCRTLNAEWNNNQLVAAFNGGVDSDAAAVWVQFNTSSSIPVVVQQGVIHPGAGISAYMPAVAVDAAGDLGLTYLESSVSEYVSMYVTGRLASDLPGTLEAPVRAAAGTSTMAGRVGDWSGISLDPSSPNTFWAGNEYGLNFWSTWLAKFTLTSSSTNQPPSVATAASASPNPVTGTTTALSVLGADDSGESNLTYTWSVLSSPAGAPSPAFSVNGTNAAKNTTVSFAQAGTYTFRVSLTDPAGLTAASSATATVTPTLCSVSVTPGSATMPNSGTQQFTAVARDQFGNALGSKPSFVWSLSGIGSLDGTGMYKAPNTGNGSATVSATSGATSGTASVIVTSAPPTVVIPASGSPSPVTGTTTALSVLGTDAASESSLTYSWLVVSGPVGASSPIFSANASNAAKNTMATFFQAGTYAFQVTLTNPVGLTAASSVIVTVNQTVSSVGVTPGSATLPDNATQQFTPTGWDQFGNALGSPPSFWWSLDGIGTLDATGMYTAPSSGSGSATVTASVATTGSAPASTATMSASATITVTSGPSLTAVAISSNQVKLSWTAASNVTGYRVRRSANGGAWSQIASPTGNTTSYTDTNLSAGATYTYLVQAYDATSSVDSNPASVTLAPKAPGGGLSAKAISSSQINLAWSNVSGETGFKIQRSSDNVQWDQVGTAGANVLTFQDTGLNPVTMYYYRVLATNAGGDSAPGSVSKATTLVAPPAAPSNLAARAVSSTRINLSWTDNSSNEQGFRIQRSSDGGNAWLQIGQVAANTTTFADTHASSGITYLYLVCAYNGGGNSPSSNLAQGMSAQLPTRLPEPSLGVYVNAGSKLGQEMLNDAMILKAFSAQV
jgi:fibronectin type 3 domain-containing protein